MRKNPFKAALLALLLSACELSGSSGFVPPVASLAKVVPIAVGTRQFYLPVVTVTWAGQSNVLRPCPEGGSQWLCSVPLETLVAYSGIRGKPVWATSVEIKLEGYSSYYNKRLEEYFYIPQLCGMLIQRWARQQCSGPSLFRDALRRFTLIHVDTLAKYNNIGSIEGQKESVNQVVRKMRFVNDEPSTDCSSDGHGLCTVAMRISNKVLAVWIVSSSDDANSIRRQAAAIRAFLNNATGREENYEGLKEILSRAT